MTIKQKTILLDHGAGGRASHELIKDVFLKHFGGQEASGLEDCALVPGEPGRIAFSTDTFVVTPIFFPGGDIGELAVNGTVNDIAMRGARPMYLSAGFILEEGLAVDDLDRIVASMAKAAKKAEVKIIAGDTKVVPKGAADKVFINTSGFGFVSVGLEISARRAQPGDKVILSGTMADHGMAVLCQREGLSLETEIISDTAPLAGMIRSVLDAAGSNVHVFRDPTRGGVGTTLNEIAESSGVGVMLDEESLPVSETVRGACDILGLDPLYVANEGKLLVIVSPDSADKALAAIRENEYGRNADIIGEITADRPGRVFLRTAIGGTRIVDMLTGEQLPRIC